MIGNALAVRAVRMFVPCVWLVVLVKFISRSSVYGLQPILDVSDLFDYLSDSCVVLATEPVLPATAGILADLEPVVAKAHVEVGRIDINVLDVHPFVHVNWSGKSDKPPLFLLKRLPRDRSCLLKTDLLHRNLQAVVYGGPLQSGLVLQFLNEYCNTFFTVDGGETAAGQHRLQILDSLHVVRSQPHVTLQQLVHRCGKSLAKFLYTGVCSNTEFCSANDETSCENAAELDFATFQLPRCQVLEHTPSKEEFFEQYLSHSSPFVIKNAVSRWPAMQKWSNKFFRTNFGNHQVHIKLTPSLGEYEGVESRNRWTDDLHMPAEVLEALQFPELVMVRPAGVEMSVNQFLDLVEKKSLNASRMSAYLEYSSLKDVGQELEHDVEPLSFLDGLLDLSMQNVWLSDGNTLGKLHFDQYDNVLCQVDTISGTKQLIIFDPTHTNMLYEGHIAEAILRYADGEFYRDTLMESTALTMSPVDITEPNFEKFPLSAGATPLNCTIEAGDALFMPAFWWHEVQSFPSRSEMRNLAVNFWYEPFLTKEFPCSSCKLDVNELYRHLL